MKHIKPTLRALCLVALLGMTSGNAMAYGRIQTNEEINSLMTNGDHITVFGGNVRIPGLYVADVDAVIVLPGVKVEIKDKELLDNHGTIYIFGTLDANNVLDYNNSGTIYLVGDGKLMMKGDWHTIPPVEVEESNIVKDVRKVEGKPATDTEHGLKDYWEKGIEFNGDYCPIFYYEDEACTSKIDNIEKWKENGGIIYSLPLYKKEAIEAIDNEIEGMTILTDEDMGAISGFKTMISGSLTIAEVDRAKNDAFGFIQFLKVKEKALAAIRSAMQGETSAYLTKLVQPHIDIIYSSDKEEEIENAQNAAIEILNGVIDTYKTIKAEALGTMGTKQSGPAIEVIKGGEKVILYSPDKVNYIKVKVEE